MTVNDIKKKVAKINATKSFSEKAHILEDNLYTDFVRHVSVHGTPELSDMAKVVLETKDIRFYRWC